MTGTITATAPEMVSAEVSMKAKSDKTMEVLEDDSGFEDYSVATQLEKFAAAVEEQVRKWMSAGLESLAFSCDNAASFATVSEVLAQDLPFRKEPYILALHVPRVASDAKFFSGEGPPVGKRDGRQQGKTAGLRADLAYAASAWWPQRRFQNHARYEDELHKLQRWFGVDIFLTLTPAEQNRGTVRHEATTLRSAAAIALANVFLAFSLEDSVSLAGMRHLASLPLFVPVGLAERDAWMGVSFVGSSTVFFEADCNLDVNEGPMFIDDQLKLFGSRMLAAAPEAAQLCLDLAVGARGPAAAPRHDIAVSSCIVHVVDRPWDMGFYNEAYAAAKGDIDFWDGHAPWQPWIEEPDPVGGLHIDVSWNLVPLADLAKEGEYSAKSAHVWRLRLLDDHGMRVLPSRGAGGAPAVQWQRSHMSLAPLATYDGWELPSMEFPEGTFASQLKQLSCAIMQVTEADSWGDVLNEQWWTEVELPMPASPAQHAVNLFANDALRGDTSLPTVLSANAFAERVAGAADAVAAGGASAPAGVRLPGAPPPGSPLAVLALHMIKLENPHAIAVLWRAFSGRLAQEHCQSGIAIGSAAWRSRAPLDPTLECGSYLHLWLLELDASIEGRNRLFEQQMPGVSAGAVGAPSPGNLSESCAGLPGIAEEPALESTLTGVSVDDGAAVLRISKASVAVDHVDVTKVSVQADAAGADNIICDASVDPAQAPAGVDEAAHLGGVDATEASNAHGGKEGADAAGGAPEAPRGAVAAAKAAGAAAASGAADARVMEMAHEARMKAALAALEMAPPVQVMVSAFISCLQTGTVALQASDGAQLPCVARHFEPFYDAVRSVTQAAWELVRGDHALQGVAKARRWGTLPVPYIMPKLAEEELDHLESLLASLLARFSWLERLVVTAESLLARLPGLPAAVSCLLERALAGGGPPGPHKLDAQKAGEGLDERYLAVYNLASKSERVIMEQIMHHQWDRLNSQLSGAGAKSAHGAASSAGSGQDDGGRRTWGRTLRKETVLLCRGTTLGSAHELQFRTPHRMYVQQGPGELRVATSIVTTDL